MIYIIGDSHVSVFSGTDKTHDNLRHIQPEFGTCYTLSQGQLRTHINRFEQQIEYFCPIKVGSYTAYNIYDKLPIILQAIEEYEITKDNYIFFSFGEIDIRHHIGFKLTSETILTDLINTVVKRYFKMIKHIKDNGYNVGVYGAPPSTVGGNNGIQYSTVKVRNSMTKTYNDMLSNECKKIEIPFKSISDKLINSNGVTDESYMIDDIHLSQKAMPFIKKEFSDII